MNDFIDVVSKLGFPIAAFIVCAWFLKYVYDRSLTQLDKSLTEVGSLAKSVAELTQAVNHNTEVLAELVKEVRANDNSRADM